MIVFILFILVEMYVIFVYTFLLALVRIMYFYSFTCLFVVFFMYVSMYACTHLSSSLVDNFSYLSFLFDYVRMYV